MKSSVVLLARRPCSVTPHVDVPQNFSRIGNTLAVKLLIRNFVRVTVSVNFVEQHP